MLLATSLLIALAGAACGDDDDARTAPGSRDSGPKEDGGGKPGDRDSGSEPSEPRDSGAVPGEKPPELAEEACAVDTNKLYSLASTTDSPRSTQLAVDLVGSQFAFAYIGDSDQCIDAVYATMLSGGSGIGEPEKIVVADDCTTVEHVSIVHNGEVWLAVISDTRMGTSDLWLQSFGGEGDKPAAIRLTESGAEETESAIATVRCDDPMLLDCSTFEESALVAWAELEQSGHTRLGVRPLALDGTPSGDPLVLEESDEWVYAGLTMQQIGERFVALGYRRYGPSTGKSEIVLDVLDAKTGMRDRESWVLSPSAGATGNVDLGTDSQGGGVLYSLGQGTSQQLWFQQLDRSGRAAPVMAGTMIGGPADPVRIVGPPTAANDASLTKLINGFAVAYRIQAGGGVPEPRIRAHFLDRFGRDIGKSDVALAGPQGARTAIESAYDGRITIGWSDTTEEGESTLTAVKLPCVGGL